MHTSNKPCPIPFRPVSLTVFVKHLTFARFHINNYNGAALPDFCLIFNCNGGTHFNLSSRWTINLNRMRFWHQWWTFLIDDWVLATQSRNFRSNRIYDDQLSCQQEIAKQFPRILGDARRAEMLVAPTSSSNVGMNKNARIEWWIRRNSSLWQEPVVFQRIIWKMANWNDLIGTCFPSSPFMPAY